MLQLTSFFDILYCQNHSGGPEFFKNFEKNFFFKFWKKWTHQIAIWNVLIILYYRDKMQILGCQKKWSKNVLYSQKCLFEVYNAQKPKKISGGCAPGPLPQLYRCADAHLTRALGSAPRCLAYRTKVLQNSSQKYFLGVVEACGNWQ